MVAIAYFLPDCWLIAIRLFFTMNFGFKIDQRWLYLQATLPGAKKYALAPTRTSLFSKMGARGQLSFHMLHKDQNFYTSRIYTDCL